jgi:hypothetical protein
MINPSVYWGQDARLALLPRSSAMISQPGIAYIVERLESGCLVYQLLSTTPNLEAGHTNSFNGPAGGAE